MQIEKHTIQIANYIIQMEKIARFDMPYKE